MRLWAWNTYFWGNSPEFQSPFMTLSSWNDIWMAEICSFFILFLREQNDNLSNMNGLLKLSNLWEGGNIPRLNSNI